MRKTSPDEATARYQIIAKEGTFTVRAIATGMLGAFGHDPTITITDYQGTAEFNPVDLESAYLRMEIQAASLRLASDVSDKDRKELEHRMQEEVLQSDSFPVILYETTQVTASKTAENQYWVALKGSLSLRGVTRSLNLPARVVLNSGSMRAFGDFSLLLSDYEIDPPSALGGSIRLKDELKLSFNVVARKTE